MKSIPTMLTAPWAIEPHWLRVIYGIWSRGKVDAAALAQARTDWEARRGRAKLEESGAPVPGTGGTLRIVGNVGVVAISGPLVRHADLFHDISGGTSYDAIWRGLEAALRERTVEKILLRANSPGGEADGVGELARFIRAADQRKPIWSHCDLNASACLWLTSQSRRIIATPEAEIGSIGVRCAILDDSAAEEMEGIREIEIISSVSPGKRAKPIDDEVIARLQTRIDDLAALFVAAVAEGLGVDEATVREDFGRGDVMIASKALEVGLIHEIGDFNSTLAALAAFNPASSTTAARASRMAHGARAMKTEPTAQAETSNAEWQCAGCKKMQAPTQEKYCADCKAEEPDGDEHDEPDGDEHDEPDGDEEARAAKAFRAEVRERLGVATDAKALGRIAALLETEQAHARLVARVAKIEANGRRAQLRGLLERGMAGTATAPPKLSIGRIEKGIPVVLRGPTKASYVAAIEQLHASADTAKRAIRAEEVIAAACSVDLSGEDLEAIAEYIGGNDRVAAPIYPEPDRGTKQEAADIEALDETAQFVAREAAKARATLDRNAKKAQ